MVNFRSPAGTSTQKIWAITPPPPQDLISPCVKHHSYSTAFAFQWVAVPSNFPVEFPSLHKLLHCGTALIWTLNLQCVALHCDRKMIDIIIGFAATLQWSMNEALNCGKSAIYDCLPFGPQYHTLIYCKFDSILLLPYPKNSIYSQC